MPAKTIRELIAEEVKRARSESGYTQEQIAEAAKISVRGYQYIERGASSPKAETLIRLMLILKINVNVFEGKVNTCVFIRTHNNKR